MLLVSLRCQDQYAVGANLSDVPRRRRLYVHGLALPKLRMYNTQWRMCAAVEAKEWTSENLNQDGVVVVLYGSFLAGEDTDLIHYAGALGLAP